MRQKQHISTFSLVRLAGLACVSLLAGCQTLPWQQAASQPPVESAVTASQSQTRGLPAEETLAPVANTKDSLQQTDETIAAAEAADPAITQANVWHRIRQGFQLSKPDNRRVQREIDWYLKHPEYLERVQQRARPYLPYILAEVEKRQLPTELVLLPVVESAFQPFAYSPGRASGLWQFIPSTGRMYGLKQTWWYDGRRDVVAASNAALDYLTALSNKFDGDWELALAAYNAGAGNVNKAIRKNRRKQRPTDFWSLKLPRETTSYVPRLLAISKIIEQAPELGLQLQDIPYEPYFARVDTGGQIDLAKAAELAGISMDELYQLNPAFNRWATDPDGPHHLLVPIEVKASFETALASLDDADRLQWLRYKIKKGDSLSVIARRFRTTDEVLKSVNKLRSSRIRAGKHLLIPVSSQPDEKYHLSQSQRLAAKQSKQRSGNRIEYTVQPGDNLWDIARSHGVSYKKLAAWNGMAPRDTLHPGQDLVLWVANSENQLAVLNPSQINPNRETSIRYTIRKGDSLSRIADKFNVKVSDLRKWNRLKGRYLQPGQTLKLKVDVTEQL
ncbi:MAG: LysM peptidoglycan-binding domain-containing protein [Chromatiales bacterium]